MEFEPAEVEGLAISESNRYRTRRPKKRPRKTWGHGVVKQMKWKERLKKRKEEKKQIFTRPVSVPKVPMPDFLSQLLARRPESRRIMSAEIYASIKDKVKG